MTAIYQPFNISVQSHYTSRSIHFSSHAYEFKHIERSTCQGSKTFGDLQMCMAKLNLTNEGSEHHRLTLWLNLASMLHGLQCCSIVCYVFSHIKIIIYFIIFGCFMSCQPRRQSSFQEKGNMKSRNRKNSLQKDKIYFRCVT